jgi:hypothetical protein
MYNRLALMRRVLQERQGSHAPSPHGLGFCWRVGRLTDCLPVACIGPRAGSPHCV